MYWAIFFNCPSPLCSVSKWWKASSSGWLLGIFLFRYSTGVVVVGVFFFVFFFYKNRPVIFVQHFTWRTKQGTQQQQRAQWQLPTLRAATISKPTRAASLMSQTLSRFFLSLEYIRLNAKQALFAKNERTLIRILGTAQPASWWVPGHLLRQLRVQFLHLVAFFPFHRSSMCENFYLGLGARK